MQTWLYMPALCFFVVLEGIFTTLWLQQPNQRITDNLAYRGAELVVILLVTRLFTWVISIDYPDWRLISDYLEHPWLLFSDPLFIIGAVLIILSWIRSMTLTLTFSALAIDRAEAAYYLKPQRERNDDQRPFQHNRSKIVHLFFMQWIWGGIFLAICATVTTFDIREFADGFNLFSMTRLGLQPSVLMAILGYFLAGFLLMSQAKLQTLNAQWLHSGMTKSKKIEKNWYRTSTRILLIIAFLAALLPIGSTTGIGKILESLIGVVFSVITMIYFFFIGLLALLFAGLWRWRNRRGCPN